MSRNIADTREDLQVLDGALHAVMREGWTVERGDMVGILQNLQHEHARTLLSAVSFFRSFRVLPHLR